MTGAGQILPTPHAQMQSLQNSYQPTPPAKPSVGFAVSEVERIYGRLATFSQEIYRIADKLSGPEPAVEPAVSTAGQAKETPTGSLGALFMMLAAMDHILDGMNDTLRRLDQSV